MFVTSYEKPKAKGWSRQENQIDGGTNAWQTDTKQSLWLLK